MEGLQSLMQLSETIKNGIITKYGSLVNFYTTVFKLYGDEYKFTMAKPTGFEHNLLDIKTKLLDIADELELYGAIDGTDITLEISHDHSEIIANNQVQHLDNYLKQFGLDYETMKKWMKDNYGI